MLPNSEWILLGLLAAILLKPEDIPVIARAIAKFVRQAQQIWQDLVKLDDSATAKKHPFNCAPPNTKIPPAKD